MKFSKSSLTSTAKNMMYGLIAQANFGGGLKPPTENDVFAPAAGYPTDTDLPLFYVTRGISVIITLMTTLAGLIFLFQFLLGAISWISAGGEQKKISDARDRITQGVIGLVIIVIS